MVELEQMIPFLNNHDVIFLPYIVITFFTNTIYQALLDDHQDKFDS